MPNIASAKKRVRVTKAKTLRNKAVKSNLKTVIKSAVNAVNNKLESREDAIRFAIKKLDQAGAKGIYHKNKIANKKSQLQKILNESK